MNNNFFTTSQNKTKIKEKMFFFSKFDELFKKRTLIINIIKNC